MNLKYDTQLNDYVNGQLKGLVIFFIGMYGIFISPMLPILLVSLAVAFFGYLIMHVAYRDAQSHMYWLKIKRSNYVKIIP